MKELSVGVFDSGVGGLSVWRELIKELPSENFIYVSDSAYCPYGPKGADEIKKRVFSITDFLITKGVKLVVVACNTATAAAIDALRFRYPQIPFVGMEPAVKPAALHSQTGVIGVLATAGTFKGRLYNGTVERFASDIEVIEQVGEGLVEIVESGKTDSEEARKLLEKYIRPMISKNVDHIVLGCTHYPFLADNIRSIAGNKVKIIDPAPAVAAHTHHILEERGLLNDNKEPKKNSTRFYSTGSIDTLKSLALSISPEIENGQFNYISI